MKWPVDWDGYLDGRVGDILNERGGRGHDRGVRVFHCPFCGDRRGRGWLNGVTGRAGCLNAGCEAEPHLDGGALEWVRRQEGFATRGRALTYLLTTFPLSVWATPTLEAAAAVTADWCRLPPEVHPLVGKLTRYGQEAVAFAHKQWGVDVRTLLRAKVQYCIGGRYAYRLVVPVVMGRVTVAFQARTFRNGEPKYLTSRYGVQADRSAECGRPAERLLYNLDMARPGGSIILVEGMGDVLALLHHGCEHPPVALLGIELSQEKIKMLHATQPTQVLVAMDNQPDALRRGASHVLVLQTFGVPAVLASWQGGKDAGAGAELQIRGAELAACVRGILGEEPA